MYDSSGWEEYKEATTKYNLEVIKASPPKVPDNWHTRALFIKYLLAPEAPRTAKAKRIRARPTEFKILQGMFQLNKNKARNKWTDFACGKKLIGKASCGAGRTSITRFINGSGSIFFNKTSRFQATNIYEFHDWAIELLVFFERTGMMRGYMENFEKWRATFLKKLNNWLLPKLESGCTLEELL